MNQDINTNELIKERYSNLPEIVKKAITSSELLSKINEIGKKNNLMLDQIGMLQTNILLTMLGIQPSSEFIKNIISELEIDKNKAETITKDVNSLIFDSIKTYLRELEETNNENEEGDNDKKTQQSFNSNEKISPIEKAGDFTIEKHGELPKFERNVAQTSPQTDNHTDIIVDHLLSKPNSQPEEVIVKPAPKMEKDGVSITAGTEDPYRETF